MALRHHPRSAISLVFDTLLLPLDLTSWTLRVIIAHPIHRLRSVLFSIKEVPAGIHLHPIREAYFLPAALGGFQFHHSRHPKTLWAASPLRIGRHSPSYIILVSKEFRLPHNVAIL